MSKRGYIFFIVAGVVAFLAYPIWNFVRSIHQVSAENQKIAVSSSPIPTLEPTPDSFHIVLVPGHETNTGGAEFKNIYERDLAVDLAQDISDILKTDSRFSVLIARNHQAWNEPFASYFANQESSIMAFKNEHQVIQKALFASGQEKVVPDAAYHSTVNQKTSIELYGINKWSNENNVDMLIHIHFNDSIRPNPAFPGTNHGFDMFIPESQLPNATASKTIASYIFQELKKDFTPETGAPIGDQSLIAIGASGTLNKSSMLIEYAYIYEKQLVNPTTRDDYLKLMAKQTVAGIEDYLVTKNSKN